MIRTESDQDFYQIDFTTVSDWEVFISKLEEVFCKWNLCNMTAVQEYGNKWSVKSEQISYIGMEFLLSYYYLEIEKTEEGNNESAKQDNGKIKHLEEMMSLKKDFKAIPPLQKDGVQHLVQWYGLNEFLVLIPNNTTISSESQVKLIISSFSIAAGNIKCEIPMFVKILDTWQNYFVGVCISTGIRSEYQMIHLKKIPSHCKHLAGLLNVFKTQISSSLMSLDPITISVRFSYMLRNWMSFAYFDEPLDLKFITDVVDVEALRKLPFGVTCEPINNLILHVTWPEVLENVIVDSDTYTDLEPLLAPVWSLHTNAISQPNSLLAVYITEYLEICTNSSSMKDLIGDLFNRNTAEKDLSQSLNSLTESKIPGISKLIPDVVNVTTTQQQGPIPDSIIMPILYFFFPDADEHKNTTCYCVDSNTNKKSRDYNLYNMKSSMVDGLVWRLALILSHAVRMSGGIRAVAHLWYEFTQELRYRWENSILIPGVELKNPDHKTCLLNQKLQMLNCCIKKKISRETEGEKRDLTENESDEEEFYDCQADSSFNKSGDDERKLTVRHSLWNQPVGRLKRCDNMKLIYTGELMYIPITQEVTPKTEDQLEEDAAILMQLGSDTHGSELRFRLMSASLYSDMESFKAANPGAVLEDFIRWYSPRDWIEEDEVDQFGQKKGYLSDRMLIPGNMWKEVWDTSISVPAARQKRLFDDTQEAEKILYFLESMNPAKALQLLLPTFIHIAIYTVIENTNCFPFLHLDTKIMDLVKKGIAITRHSDLDISHCRELAGEINLVESIISQYKSLKYKLFPEGCQFLDQENFIKQLIDGDEVIVPFGAKGELGNRIFIIFSEVQKVNQMIVEDVNKDSCQKKFDSVFPASFENTFILRARVPSPSSTSRILPQKMIAKVLIDQIIMAGCYSHDLVFM